MNLTTDKYDAKKEMFQKLVDIAENYLSIINLQNMPTDDKSDERTMDDSVSVFMGCALGEGDILQKSMKAVKHHLIRNINPLEMN